MAEGPQLFGVRRRILIGLAFALIGSGLAIVLIIGPAEPSHQGKPLSFWLEEIGDNKPETNRDDARQAIRAIGTNAIPWLIADLRLDEPKWKRVLMQWMLKQPLVKVNYRTPDARSSQAAWAFQALGAIARPAIPELVKMLDRNPGWVPAALSWIGVDSVPALVNALTHTNPYVRANASTALANAVSAGGIPRTAPVAAVPLWLEQLKDNDANLRSHAAWGLGTIREQAELCVPALMRSLDDPSPAVQNASAKSLQDFGPAATEALPKLTNPFSSPNPNIRQAVAGALGAIGDARAVPILASGIHDPNDTVRIWTVGSLGSIGREPRISVPALVAALKDPNAMVRFKAAEVLGVFGKEAAGAVEALAEAAQNDSDEKVRTRARQSLQRLASDPAPK
jgi:HEAT repeat protein